MAGYALAVYAAADMGIVALVQHIAAPRARAAPAGMGRYADMDMLDPLPSPYLSAVVEDPKLPSATKRRLMARGKSN